VDSIPGRNVLIMDGSEVIDGAGHHHLRPRKGPLETLSSMANRFGTSGLVLITQASPMWQIPDEPGGGWAVTPPNERGFRQWRQAWRGMTTIYFCGYEAITAEENPLLGTTKEATARRHGLFHDLVGIPFFGEGGVVSELLLDASLKVQGRDVLKKWIPPITCRRPNESSWCGPWKAEGAPQASVWLDRSAMFLGAAGVSVLPMDALQHTGPSERCDAGTGYYLITVPENPEPRLPHPCGAFAAAGEQMWVTDATIKLLNDLDIELHSTDSWTCPWDRSRKLLGGGAGRWYERLRDARAMVTGGDDPDSQAVKAAIKSVYQRGITGFSRPNGHWQRPDWTQIIKATARANMWRSMRAIGTVSDVWPCETRTDAVGYATLPDAAKIGTGMGQWRVL
jgi:hypothetical protein